MVGKICSIVQGQRSSQNLTKTSWTRYQDYLASKQLCKKMIMLKFWHWCGYTPNFFRGSHTTTSRGNSHLLFQFSIVVFLVIVFLTHCYIYPDFVSQWTKFCPQNGQWNMQNKTRFIVVALLSINKKISIIFISLL